MFATLCMFVATRAWVCHLHVYGPITHAHMYLCGCVSKRVCQADQMLCCSLQGALISCVFTVTDRQQSEAGPAAGQAGMNGNAYKVQHPQGSRLTHQPDHYTHTYTCLTCFQQCKINMNINTLFSLLKVQVSASDLCVWRNILLGFFFTHFSTFNCISYILCLPTISQREQCETRWSLRPCNKIWWCCFYSVCFQLLE